MLFCSPLTPAPACSMPPPTRSPTKPACGAPIACCAGGGSGWRGLQLLPPRQDQPPRVGARRRGRGFLLRPGRADARYWAGSVMPAIALQALVGMSQACSCQNCLQPKLATAAHRPTPALLPFFLPAPVLTFCLRCCPQALPWPWLASLKSTSSLTQTTSSQAAGECSGPSVPPLLLLLLLSKSTAAGSVSGCQ